VPHHDEEKILPHRADQVFELVADVARYPEFLPWCSAARIRSRAPFGAGSAAGEILEADLVISFKVFRERFGSRVTLQPGEKRILTEYIDGPFKALHSVWTFEDLPDGQSRIRFTVDFEFRNVILARIIGLVFHEAMTRVVKAFESRAKVLYG
jgi:coenzyme Q-binding protein COQ10